MNSDTMDDDSDDKDSKRKSRNLSEKKRRDQFNLLINELSSMVSTGGRKMDKSTVLKSTISFLRNHNEIAVRSRVNEIQEDWKPTFLTNEEFTHLVLEAVDGFIMVFSSSGHIYYASESIASLLGHLPSDVLNMTVYDLASEDEQTNIYNLLLNPSEDAQQVTFSCHFRRGGPSAKNPSTFELINFVGQTILRRGLFQDPTRICSKVITDTASRTKRTPDWFLLVQGGYRPPQLIKEMPLVESSRSEFTSRHSLEWKFLFLDHRAPPIIGYLPFELLGTSGYDYYHVDDLNQVVVCHEALMHKGEGTSCYYRFLTKGQQWIWLQTRFYITYHQWTSKPEFVVCTHRVVSFTDVLKQYGKDGCEASFENSVSSPGTGVGGNSLSLSWPSKSGSKSFVRHGSVSDCTSMSADSPGPRQSVMTTHRLSKSRSSSQLVSQSSPSLHLQPQLQQPVFQVQPQPAPMPVAIPATAPFLEPPQYLTAIPVQPMVANFPSPTVLSPLPQIENLVMSPVVEHSQLQVDLQRKHAELQAMIGQQQQELRRVSEQLLMAKLGLLPNAQPQPVVSNAAPVAYQVTAAGTVSSTTTTIQGIVGPMARAPLSHSARFCPDITPLQHHQQNIMYNTPDSNTQSK
ncbi:hypothetical protein NQ317_014923 [Molorchus minor]|uniref:Clock n=1 Tax=Molorchus minor TaxID=1323400 RepID=A0ABQ9K1T7_9CUCU|nr:hypothetical protein NQ317_014923 [Molorchus minor]